MDFNSYVPQALRTCKFFGAPILDRQHGLLGLITEVGELTDDIKRMFVYNKPFDAAVIQHMRIEAGDVQWYVPVVLFSIGRDELKWYGPSTPDSLLARIGVMDGDLVSIACGLSALTGMLMVDEKLRPVWADDMTLLFLIVYVLNEMVAPILDTTGDELRAMNIAKLKLRFPDSYSDEAAMARADDKAGVANASPVNESGPESAAPQPAPGLAFDSRGVLSPTSESNAAPAC